MSRNWRYKRWFPLMLFFGAALLSAWLSSALWLGPTGAAAGPLENALPGGLNGRTLLRSGEALDVKVAPAPGIHAVAWALDGRRVGHAPELYLEHIRNGEHTLSLVYRDAQGQLYAVTSLVRVLEPDDYALLVDAVHAAITLPLWEEDAPIYLPFIRR